MILSVCSFLSEPDSNPHLQDLDMKMFHPRGHKLPVEKNDGVAFLHSAPESPRRQEAPKYSLSLMQAQASFDVAVVGTAGILSSDWRHFGRKGAC